MNAHEILASQYRASLAMLRDTVEKCPDALWASQEYPNRFWHIAYHALFYTHLYLQPSVDGFTPWGKHKTESQFLGAVPWPPERRPQIPEPYAKAEVLEYCDFCEREAGVRLPATDLTLPSGFQWLRFDKLELQLYNIRHIQHHEGQLSDRLRTACNIGVTWVGAR